MTGASLNSFVEPARRPETEHLKIDLRSDDWHRGFETGALLEKIINSWKSLAGAASWGARQSREVLDLGDTALIPDLIFEHEDGRQIYF